MLCSAYVGRIGLLESDVLFSMCQSGCVCVCVCARARVSVMRACTRVFKGTSRNTNQQSITNVTDELWQTTAAETCIGHIAFVCVHHRVQAHVCVSICG